MFLFEVLYRGTVMMFSTTSKNGGYSKELLLQMIESGYELRLNSKPYQP